MRFFRYIFILGIILIFFGLIFALNSNSATGSSVLNEELKVNNLLFFVGISLILIFGIGEIEGIKESIEKKHNIQLPVDIIYSGNVYRSFVVPPLYPNLEHLQQMRQDVYEKRKYELKSRGLNDYEIKSIDTKKYTIFLPKTTNNPISLYGTKWEELGHVTAYVLGIKDKIPNEGFALTYRFKGLLQGAKEGLFTVEKAIDEIEYTVKSVRADSALISKLKNMGLKVPDNSEMTHYDDSLFAIRKFNPSLTFRNRELDELLLELDKSIGYTMKKSKGENVSDKIRSILKKFIKK